MMPCYQHDSYQDDCADCRSMTAPSAGSVCPSCGSREKGVRCCMVENCGYDHFSEGTFDHRKVVCSDSWHSTPESGLQQVMQDAKKEIDQWPNWRKRQESALTPAPAQGAEELQPISPVGIQILDHPDFQLWFKQGYASQEPDGLWLHYTAICSLLHDSARVTAQATVDEPISKLIGDLKIALAQKDREIERLRQQLLPGTCVAINGHYPHPCRDPHPYSVHCVQWESIQKGRER